MNRPRGEKKPGSVAAGTTLTGGRGSAWSMGFLMVLALLAGCGGGDGPDPAANDEDSTLTVSAVGDGLWLEHNGLPYCNGEPGTEVLSLDGTWRFQEDPADRGLEELWQAGDRELSGWRTLEVPGVWNAVFDDLFLYKGIGWYAVDVETAVPPARPVLYFGAVFLRCRVYVNGVLAGGHEGGYTPFWVDAAGAWQPGRNRVVLRVDNRITDHTIPADTLMNPGTHGWWPYGGILRKVSLHDWPGALAFRLDAAYELGPDRKSASLDFRVGIRGFVPEETVVGLDLELFDPEGVRRMQGGIGTASVPSGGVLHLQARGELNPVRLWDVGDPQVYEVVLTLRGGDGRVLHTARHKTGFRSFEIRDGDFFLNGRRHVLRGINRHDDVPGRGSALTDGDVERDLDRIQGLSADHTRPGHYPVHPGILAGCRDRGITVTEEIPVYQIAFEQFGDPELIATTRQQLLEMIERDRNNPAVVLWSLSNEVWSFLPAALDYTAMQAELARQWDPSRPITAALLMAACILPDQVASVVDVVSINEYFGWYIAEPGDCLACFQHLKSIFPDKPVVLSEFGAGAVAGRHMNPADVGPEPVDDHSYTEEFQAWLLDIHLDAADQAGLDGTMPWILADFHMEWDPTTGKPHPVTTMNLKGLCGYDRALKLGYDVLRTAYEDPGFLGSPP